MSETKRETPEERAARYERGDVEIHPDVHVHTAGDGGFSFEDLDLSEAERVHFDRLVKAGRPSLSGTRGEGSSPKRQVRLPVELDRALTERAQRENRKPSALIRDALTEYLHVS